MKVGEEWLRVRGMGRERFGGHLADYLAEIGYSVDRTESAEPPETRITARLARANPAIPDGAKEISVRLFPTSGGAAMVWLGPEGVPDPERARFDRLVREIESHLERTVLTESHATARVSRPP